MKYFLSLTLLLTLFNTSAPAEAALTCTEVLRALPSQSRYLVSELSQALAHFTSGETLEIALFTLDEGSKLVAFEKQSALRRTLLASGVTLSDRPTLAELDTETRDWNYTFGIWVVVKSPAEAATLNNFIHSDGGKTVSKSFAIPTLQPFVARDSRGYFSEIAKFKTSSGGALEIVLTPDLSLNKNESTQSPSKYLEFTSAIRKLEIPFEYLETNLLLNLKAYPQGVKLTIKTESQLKALKDFLMQNFIVSNNLRSSASPLVEYIIFP